MHDLRLYVESQFASPYAMSAFVALHEKGLTFKLSTIDLGAHENQRPEFAAMSLTRRIPTLVHDGFALSESSAIAEYVNEVFPGPSLYPADSRERAGARQIQAWLARRRWCYYGHPALRPSGQPLDFMARLAALVPNPRANLTRYHGAIDMNWRTESSLA